MSKRCLLVLITAVIAILPAAPTAFAQANPTTPAVRVGIPAAEGNFNPFVVPQAQPLSHDLLMLVYDSLFWSQSNLDPEAWLATDAQPSEDFRTWTVSLRGDVTWHDGQPFTADDVAFTFEYFRNSGDLGRYGKHVNLYPQLASTSVVDAQTVQLSFVQPVGSFLVMPGADLPILPKHIWAERADPKADVTSLPVGTGPYKMVDYQPDQSYRLEANVNYFRGRPVVDTLHLEVEADEAALFGAIEAGELDLVAANVPYSISERIELNEELEILGTNRYQAVYLMLNQTNPTLQDRLVRKAISQALDPHLFLLEIEGGMGRVGNDSWTHPNSAWTRNPEGARQPDLQSAIQLIESLGFVLGDDGVRVGADGQPLAFTLGVNPERPDHSLAAEMVVVELAKLGMKVNIETIGAADIDAAHGIAPGVVPAVDLLLDETETHAQMDPDHLYFLFNSGAGGIGQNFGRYSNPEFDRLTQEALGQVESVRRPLVHQAQDILADDPPVIPLYFPAGLIAYKPAVYNGWWSDSGNGAFTKRAFLPDYVDTAPLVESTEGREPIALLADDYADSAEGAGRFDPILLAAGLSLLIAAALGVTALKLRGNLKEQASV